VTIVTVRAGEETHGLTVSAFTSVSPEPPLVAVMIDQRHHGHDLLEREGATLAINILAADQQELSNRFAWVKDEDRFAVGNWTTAETGAPVLEDAVAWMDCTIYSRASAGTHTIYVAEIVAAACPRSGEPPLIYWNQGYRHLHLAEHE